jgi:hypothetical protein
MKIVDMASIPILVNSTTGTIKSNTINIRNAFRRVIKNNPARRLTAIEKSIGMTDIPGI